MFKESSKQICMDLVYDIATGCSKNVSGIEVQITLINTKRAICPDDNEYYFGRIAAEPLKYE